MATEEIKGTAQKNTLIKVVDFTIDKLIEMKKAASIVGDKIEVYGMTIIPVSKVSIGFAGGGSDVSDRNKGKYKNPAGTGAGISDTPQGFLVIKDGTVNFLSVSEGKKSAAGDIISTVIAEAKALINENKNKNKNQAE